MRFSDGSSDVCSSDLRVPRHRRPGRGDAERGAGLQLARGPAEMPLQFEDDRARRDQERPAARFAGAGGDPLHGRDGRSAESRGGEEWVGTCVYRRLANYKYITHTEKRLKLRIK